MKRLQKEFTVPTVVVWTVNLPARSLCQSCQLKCFQSQDKLHILRQILSLLLRHLRLLNNLHKVNSVAKPCD